MLPIASLPVAPLLLATRAARFAGYRFIAEAGNAPFSVICRCCSRWVSERGCPVMATVPAVIAGAIGYLVLTNAADTSMTVSICLSLVELSPVLLPDTSITVFMPLSFRRSWDSLVASGWCRLSTGLTRIFHPPAVLC